MDTYQTYLVRKSGTKRGHWEIVGRYSEADGSVSRIPIATHKGKSAALTVARLLAGFRGRVEVER